MNEVTELDVLRRLNGINRRAKGKYILSRLQDGSWYIASSHGTQLTPAVESLNDLEIGVVDQVVSAELGEK